MPNYEYYCKSCEKTHLIFQKITDSPLTICPDCKLETLQRGPGGGLGLSFKGSGFYITDYARSGEKPENSPKAGGCACNRSDCQKV